MSERTIDTVEALRDPAKAITALTSDPGVGGAFPASAPVPGERLIEEPAKDAVEADAGEVEAATEPAEGEPAGEVPATGAAEAEAEGGA